MKMKMKVFPASGWRDAILKDRPPLFCLSEGDERVLSQFPALRWHHRSIGSAGVEIDRRSIAERLFSSPLPCPVPGRQTRGCGGWYPCLPQASAPGIKSVGTREWFQIAAVACCCFQGFCCYCCFTAFCRRRRGMFSDRVGCVEMLTIGKEAGGGRPLKRLRVLGAGGPLWRHLERST